jgi:hypothetical protein
MWTGPVTANSLRALYAGGEKTAPRRFRIRVESDLNLQPWQRTALSDTKRAMLCGGGGRGRNWFHEDWYARMKAVMPR